MKNESPQTYILSEIAEAERLYALHGETMGRDGAIVRQLSVYKEAIGRREALTGEMAVGAACAACAAGDKGSCCFPGIERGYERVLLLINLLMECPLPRDPQIQDSCFFVGTEGCTLKARFYFCLHYFCPHLQALLGQEAIQLVHKVLGEELSACWNLELTLRRWLSHAGSHV